MTVEAVFGIDLGTTFCACAMAEPPSGEVEQIPLSAGQGPTLASVLFVEQPREGQCDVWCGDVGAKMHTDGRTKGQLIERAKRFIGQPPTSSRSWPIGDLTLDPIDASALILRKIKQEADSYDPSRPLQRAVVTHPRDFKEPKKRATALAARLAGIDLIDTLNEPEAAAYRYFEPGAEREPGRHLVFDLGGGTLDIAVLDVPRTGTVKVVGGYGVAKLGGREWDDAMLELLIEKAYKHHATDRIDYRRDVTQTTLARLRNLARDWKERSARRRHHQRVFESHLPDGNVLQTALLVEVPEWEERCRPLVQRCAEAVERALAQAGCGPEGIVRVLPVGGSVRLKAIQALLHDFFPGRVEDISGCGCVPVDLAVAQGAARFASYMVASQMAKTTSVPAQTVSRLAVVDDNLIGTTLAHGINALAARGDEDYLECLVPQGESLPVSKSKGFYVSEAGTSLQVDVYEGPPGSLPPGVTPSARLEFPPVVKAQTGDTVLVVVDVMQSGRIKVSGVHKPSGETVEAVLRDGWTGPPSADEAGPTDEFAERRARLARITVH